MKSTIEEVYYGQRRLCEEIDAGEEYEKVNKEYSKIYDKLNEGLNKEQQQLLDELFILTGGLEGTFGCSHFKEGFKLGMLIAFEVFGE